MSDVSSAFSVSKLLINNPPLTAIAKSNRMNAAFELQRNFQNNLYYPFSALSLQDQGYMSSVVLTHCRLLSIVGEDRTAPVNSPAGEPICSPQRHQHRWNVRVFMDDTINFLDIVYTFSGAIGRKAHVEFSTKIITTIIGRVL